MVSWGGTGKEEKARAQTPELLLFGTGSKGANIQQHSLIDIMYQLIDINSNSDFCQVDELFILWSNVLLSY